MSEEIKYPLIYTAPVNLSEEEIEHIKREMQDIASDANVKVIALSEEMQPHICREEAMHEELHEWIGEYMTTYRDLEEIKPHCKFCKEEA